MAGLKLRFCGDTMMINYVSPHMFVRVCVCARIRFVEKKLAKQNKTQQNVWKGLFWFFEANNKNTELNT